MTLIDSYLMTFLMPAGSRWIVFAVLYFDTNLDLMITTLSLLFCLIFGGLIGWFAQRLKQLKSLQQHKQHSEKQLRAMFAWMESTLDFQTFQFRGLIKPDGTLIEVNQSSLNFGNLTREDILNQPFWEAHWWTISPQTQQQLQQMISRAAQGEWICDQVEILGAGETKIAIDFSLKPLSDSEGNVVLLMAEGQEIIEAQSLEDKKAENTAQQLAGDWSDLYNNAPCGYHSLNEEGVYILVNETELNWLGYSRAELIGKKKVDQLLTAKSQEIFAVHFSQLKEQGFLNELELELIGKRGNILTVLLSATAIRDETGTFMMSRSTIFNITERKKAEQAQQQSEARFRRLVESNIIGVVIGTFSGDITHANDAFLNLMGYSQQELEQGKVRWTDMTPPEYLPLDLKSQAQMLEFGSCTPFEKEYIRKDGSRVPIILGSALLEGYEEKTAVAFILDLTSLKEAKTALLIRLKQQAVITELGQQALTGIPLSNLLDQATHLVAENLAVEYCNVLELLPDGKSLLLSAGVGWQPGLVGQTIINLTSQAGYTLRSKESVVVTDFRTESRFKEPSLLQEHGVISGMSVIISGREQPFGVLGVHTQKLRHFSQDDINFLQAIANVIASAIERSNAEADIHRLNESLEQRVRERTAQLEEVNQEMQAFTYSVSHDLRAPLRAMQGFSQALFEDYKDHLDELGQEYIQRIYDASHRMDQLIQDLLAYSRITRVDLRLQQVNLNTILNEVLTNLQPEIQDKQAQVVVSTTLPAVTGQYSVLNQVLTNLFSNALKFVKPGVSPVIKIGAEKRGEWVSVWIEDNGIGIASEHRHRIFRVFERLHSTETYPGTGIGLAIVRKGIERLGGRVDVESQLDQGSRFWLELPAVEHSLLKTEPEN